jgi:hypothetical protein
MTRSIQVSQCSIHSDLVQPQLRFVGSHCGKSPDGVSQNTTGSASCSNHEVREMGGYGRLWLPNEHGVADPTEGQGNWLDDNSNSRYSLTSITLLVIL